MPFAPHTSEAFAKRIERYVATKHTTYLDAIITFCTDRGIEPEAIVPFLSDKIKTQLAREGQSLNLLQKSAALPLD